MDGNTVTLKEICDSPVHVCTPHINQRAAVTLLKMLVKLHAISKQRTKTKSHLHLVDVLELLLDVSMEFGQFSRTFRAQNNIFLS